MSRERKLAEPGPHASVIPPAPQAVVLAWGWLVAVAEHEINSCCCHSRSSNVEGEGPAYRKGKKLMVPMATVEDTLELSHRPASSFFKSHKPETEVEF